MSDRHPRRYRRWHVVTGWILGVRFAIGIVALVVGALLFWAWLLTTPAEERY
jgi:hypothetical protein